MYYIFKSVTASGRDQWNNCTQYRWYGCLNFTVFQKEGEWRVYVACCIKYPSHKLYIFMKVIPKPCEQKLNTKWLSSNQWHSLQVLCIKLFSRFSIKLFSIALFCVLYIVFVKFYLLYKQWSVYYAWGKCCWVLFANSLPPRK